jgi:hypothetical protein
MKRPLHALSAYHLVTEVMELLLFTTAKGKPMHARMRTRVLVLLALVLVGCAAAPDGAVALQTHPQLTICPAARVSGVLVADSNYGLAYQNEGGVQGVIWPRGYSARREAGVVFLIDPSGRGWRGRAIASCPPAPTARTTLPFPAATFR